MAKVLKFFKKKWYLGILTVLLVAYILYRNNYARISQLKQNGYVVKKSTLKDILSLSGQVDAEEKISLKFQTSGRLAWVGVKEGDLVKKSQAVASLDQRDLKNRLTKYLNSYAIERNNFEQVIEDEWNQQYDLSQSLRDQARRDLQNNQYNLDNSVLDVELQNLSMEYANLYSPIDGIVTRVDTPYPGVNVTPAGAQFDVVNPDTVFLSATAEQTDVVKLKQGMRANVVFDAYPDTTYTSNLYYIAYTPDPSETGTVYDIKLKLDDRANALPLKMGMTGDLDFKLKERDNVLSVPTSYLGRDKKGAYVYIFVGDKKTKKYVTTGEEVDVNTIVTSGLREGDVVYD